MHKVHTESVDYTNTIYGLKGKFGHFEDKRKGAKSLKPEMPPLPKLVCMHFTSINFYLHKFFGLILFFDPHGLYIVHGLMGNFCKFEGKRDGAKSPKPERPCPPKLVYVYTLLTSADRYSVAVSYST